MQSVVSDVESSGAELQSHEPASGAAGAAQAAASGPANEVTSEAGADRVKELEQAKPQEFNKETFKAALRAKIAEKLPKTQDEAKDFENSGKLEAVKADVTTQVDDERTRAVGPVEQTNKAPLDTSGHTKTEGTPVEAPPAAPPPQVDATAAAPDPAPESATDLTSGSKDIDAQMKEADVTDDQLREGNEPTFDEALGAKSDLKDEEQAGPEAYREDETVIVSGAQGDAQAVVTEHGALMAKAHDQAMDKVGQAQTSTTSKNEAARQKIANDLEKIYNSTKEEVDKILGDLEQDVTQKFDQGAAKANSIFKSYVHIELAKYLLDRYAGSILGAWHMLRDAVKGLPEEVNEIYVKGKELYLQHMDVVLDDIAEHVATKLTEAKTKVQEGRTQVTAYVEALPKELQKIGGEAANDIQGRFDELEQSVSDKQTQLVDMVAQKYTESVTALDAEIKEMKASHRGLWDRAKEAIGGAIQQILDLKKLLESTFAKCRDAVSLVIKHPIKFLKNLVSGVGAGLKSFVSNFGTHLKTGFMEWLTGALGGAGIHLPETFDLKGIAMMVLDILGLTKERFRERAVKLLGENVVQAIELGSEIFIAVKDGGLAGLWEWIKGQLGQLKDMVLGAVEDWLIKNVVEKGITTILSMLNPASAFVKAIMMIYDVIKFFVERGRQIIALVNAIADSVIAIANGDASSVAKAIESALAKAIPVALGFLGALAGINGVTEAIQNTIKGIQETVWGAIDWVIEKAKKMVGNLAELLKGGKKKDEKGSAEEDDEKKHERMANDAVHALENTPAKADESAEKIGDAVQDEAGSQEDKYQPQLEDGVTISISVDNLGQIEDGELNFTVTIAPNNTAKTGKIRLPNGLTAAERAQIESKVQDLDVTIQGKDIVVKIADSNAVTNELNSLAMTKNGKSNGPIRTGIVWWQKNALTDEAHHIWPKWLGGAIEQDTMLKLPRLLHNFKSTALNEGGIHQMLNQRLRMTQVFVGLEQQVKAANPNLRGLINKPNELKKALAQYPGLASTFNAEVHSILLNIYTDRLQLQSGPALTMIKSQLDKELVNANNKFGP